MARRPVLTLARSQARLMASPTRLDLLGFLVARGPCAVADLGRALGRPADGLYRHLRLLVKSRLATMSERRPAGRRRERIVDAAASHYRVDYDPATGRGGPEFRRVVAASLRGLSRHLERLDRHPVFQAADPRKLFHLGQETGRLTPREVDRVQHLLVAIRRIFERSRSKMTGRLYTVTLALVPNLVGRRSRTSEVK